MLRGWGKKRKESVSFLNCLKTGMLAVDTEQNIGSSMCFSTFDGEVDEERSWIRMLQISWQTREGREKNQREDKYETE